MPQFRQQDAAATRAETLLSSIMIWNVCCSFECNVEKLFSRGTFTYLYLTWNLAAKELLFIICVCGQPPIESFRLAEIHFLPNHQPLSWTLLYHQSCFSEMMKPSMTFACLFVPMNLRGCGANVADPWAGHLFAPSHWYPWWGNCSFFVQGWSTTATAAWGRASVFACIVHVCSCWFQNTFHWCWSAHSLDLHFESWYPFQLAHIRDIFLLWSVNGCSCLKCSISECWWWLAMPMKLFQNEVCNLNLSLVSFLRQQSGGRGHPQSQQLLAWIKVFSFISQQLSFCSLCAYLPQRDLLSKQAARKGSAGPRAEEGALAVNCFTSSLSHYLCSMCLSPAMRYLLSFKSSQPSKWTFHAGQAGGAAWESEGISEAIIFFSQWVPLSHWWFPTFYVCLICSKSIIWGEGPLAYCLNRLQFRQDLLDRRLLSRWSQPPLWVFGLNCICETWTW